MTEAGKEESQGTGRKGTCAVERLQWQPAGARTGVGGSTSDKVLHSLAVGLANENEDVVLRREQRMREEWSPGRQPGSLWAR